MLRIREYSGFEMRAPKTCWKGKEHDMENIKVQGHSIGQINPNLPRWEQPKKGSSFFDAAVISKGRTQFLIPKLGNGFLISIYSDKIF